MIHNLHICRPRGYYVGQVRRAGRGSADEEQGMSNWIPISERLPTREDADELGEVVWKWAHGGTSAARFGSHPPGAVAWLPLPPYTPPKPGPTNEEISLLFIGARGNSWVAQDIRRWFADVTARIEREREGGAIDARGFPLKERGK